MDDLHKCWWCGSHEVRYSWLVKAVFCERCEARGSFIHDESAAVAQWNAGLKETAEEYDPERKADELGFPKYWCYLTDPKMQAMIEKGFDLPRGCKMFITGYAVHHDLKDQKPEEDRHG